MNRRIEVEAEPIWQSILATFGLVASFVVFMLWWVALGWGN